MQIIRDALAKYDFVGVRGLNGVNANKRYRKGQYLKRSYDLWDDREFTYRSNAKFLPGTSCRLVNADMSDDEIQKIIDDIKNGYGKKICLIAGDTLYRDEAYDYGEALIGNEWATCRKGAIFVDYLDAEVL